MEEPAFILMAIFGTALLLTAFIIISVSDPRELPFFTAIHPITSMPLNQARAEARIIAKYVAIIGLIILFLSLAALLFCE
ncbi:hypothetical protein SAMN05216582_1365 [Selenomonas ruminantium]|uniref:Uncharacterized protein n=1 Tax=Selenomonas ruminantium TaxID=971 RepID=A0A1M6XFK6_SELRU|nr:hypothetical protein [Selenomonas ruminantium]SHL04595.1 hypothetical protein SAMN05216582_1365 [Selenomonas ruminantium]